MRLKIMFLYVEFSLEILTRMFLSLQEFAEKLLTEYWSQEFTRQSTV